MQIDNCINYICSRSQQIVLQIFRQEFVHLAITPAQYGVISYLIECNQIGASADSEAEYISHSDIAHKFGLEGSTITGIIDRLEKNGLVKRHVSPDDRRVSHVFVTPLGLSINDDMLEAAERGNKIIEEKIGTANFTQLKKILIMIYEGD